MLTQDLLAVVEGRPYGRGLIIGVAAGLGCALFLLSTLSSTSMPRRINAQPSPAATPMITPRPYGRPSTTASGSWVSMPGSVLTPDAGEMPRYGGR